MCPVFYVLNLVLLILTALCCLRTASVEAQTLAQEIDIEKLDVELIKLVSAAVKERIPLKKVERFVGKRASFSTERLGDRIMLDRLNLSKDSDHAEEFAPVESAKDIIFYVRPSQERGPRLVGIAYDRNGVPRPFFAVVLDL